MCDWNSKILKTLTQATTGKMLNTQILAVFCEIQTGHLCTAAAALQPTLSVFNKMSGKWEANVKPVCS